MDLSETLTKIRNYTRENLELKKCHHFLFNLPLDKTSIKADVLVIGLNPGEGPFDWDYVNTPNTPTEETHEFDFHEELGKGRASIRWSQLCKEYLPDSKIFQSEFGSKNHRHFFHEVVQLESRDKLPIILVP